MMQNIQNLLLILDPVNGQVGSQPILERRLSDLKDVFADTQAFDALLEAGDSVVYSVSGFESPPEPGNLNLAIGIIHPGRVGAEFFMTKGHFHAWRPASEIYIGLRGEGVMLLETEDGRQAQMVPLEPNLAVYVPGGTAHRTMNTGVEPLVYLGIYPAQAGHDYESIARQNFRHIVISENGRPVFKRRA